MGLRFLLVCFIWFLKEEFYKAQVSFDLTMHSRIASNPLSRYPWFLSARIIANPSAQVRGWDWTRAHLHHSRSCKGVWHRMAEFYSQWSLRSIKVNFDSYLHEWQLVTFITNSNKSLVPNINKCLSHVCGNTLHNDKMDKVGSYGEMEEHNGGPEGFQTVWYQWKSYQY